jgi:TrmH family RNA methyltransferase
MAADRIASPTNPRIKALVRLRNRRQREREGRFLIEGARELSRALAAGVSLDEAFVCPPLVGSEGGGVAARLRELDVRTTELSEAAFAKVSLRERPDGLLATAQTWSADPTELRLPAEPLLLLLDGLEKPGNLGALLRTADGVGVDAVLVSGAGTDLFNPNVIRASMGSLFARPVLALDEGALLTQLRAWGVRVVAATPEAATTYWDADLRGPLAIALGSEHAGLAPSWRSEADLAVAIPMAGLADSLNVATAGALLLYEAQRQRRGPQGLQSGG